jgi:hypothetical protein
MMADILKFPERGPFAVRIERGHGVVVVHA